MHSFNGIGTTFYGKKELKNDSSYITTKWFIFLLLPIFPVGTFRVRRNADDKARNILGMVSEYEIIEELTLDKKQIILWYTSVYGTIIIILILLFFIV